ncbi:MAG: hypothetical protein CMF62_04020 [Magnetococcales bacterium]|nr:hypothetical protein [Magnetococcales bacterium]
MSFLPFTDDNLEDTILDVLLDNIEKPLSLHTIYKKIKKPTVPDEFGISDYFNKNSSYYQQHLKKLYNISKSIDESYDNVYRFYYSSKQTQNMVLIMSKKNHQEVKQILNSYYPSDNYFQDFMVNDYLDQVLNKRSSWYESFDHTNKILGKPVETWANNYGYSNIFSSLFGDSNDKIKTQLEEEQRKMMNLLVD